MPFRKRADPITPACQPNRKPPRKASVRPRPPTRPGASRSSPSTASSLTPARASCAAAVRREAPVRARGNTPWSASPPTEATMRPTTRSSSPSGGRSPLTPTSLSRRAPRWTEVPPASASSTSTPVTTASPRFAPSSPLPPRPRTPGSRFEVPRGSRPGAAGPTSTSRPPSGRTSPALRGPIAKGWTSAEAVATWWLPRPDTSPVATTAGSPRSARPHFRHFRAPWPSGSSCLSSLLSLPAPRGRALTSMRSQTLWRAAGSGRIATRLSPAQKSSSPPRPTVGSTRRCSRRAAVSSTSPAQGSSPTTRPAGCSWPQAPAWPRSTRRAPGARPRSPTTSTAPGRHRRRLDLCQEPARSRCVPVGFPHRRYHWSAGGGRSTRARHPGPVCQVAAGTRAGRPR